VSEVVRRVGVDARIQCGDGAPLMLIAGPCVAESLDLALTIAGEVARTCQEIGMGYVFKASFDKANRTSIDSYRGPGREAGLAILEAVRSQIGVPVTTDVHDTADVEATSPIVDLLQIPAFLCRQTDLLVAAARSGRPVNVKKGQFLSPREMQFVTEKLIEGGAKVVLVTERGTTFGYNDLVVDFRGLEIMRPLGFPIVFDATHSVQRPGGRGASSDGARGYAACLARAAVAVGIDALFMEVHPDPDRALSDGPNSIPLHRMGALLRQLHEIHELVRTQGHQPSDT